MDTAIAYIRVSTDRQATDGTSLTTQQRKVDDHVASKGYAFDRLFTDEGESAKTADRGGLQEMLAYAKKNKGKVQVCIFPKVDRFARYAEDYFFLKGYLRQLGVRLESTDERFDDSPVGRYMEGMLAVTAQFDNEIRAERSKGGMVEAALAGRFVGGTAPVGFRNCKDDAGKATIEPDPVTGPIMAEAFERLAWRGFRPLDVRAWLTERGVHLCRSNFYRAIHRGVYIGQIDRFGVKRQGAPPFLPLVTEETFYKAHAAFQPRDLPPTYQRDREEFPLRGTARCRCGMFLIAGFSQGRSKRYAYYRCKQCPRVNISPKLMDAAWIHLLGRTKRRYAVTDRTRHHLDSAIAGDRVDSRRQRMQLEQEISALSKVQQALAVKCAQGIVPDHIATEQLRDLDRQIGQKRVQLKDCQLDDAPWEMIIEFSEHFLTELEKRWRLGDLTTKKHLQSFFYPDGATVVKSDSRTAFRAAPTGSKRVSGDQESPTVRCRHKDTNFVAPAEQADLSPRDLLRLYSRLFDEFGQENAGS